MGFKAEQFVKSVDENLFCSICHEVFEDPVSCMHGHTFCKVCIHEWLETNKTCPLLDNSYLSKKKLVPQFTVKGIIDSLEVYCNPHFVFYDLNEGETVLGFQVGCDWVGKVQHLTQHRKTCPFQEVQCSHVKCKKKIQRRELEHHEKICDFRKVKCEKCGMVLFQNAKEKHIIDDCLHALTLCPNHCKDNKLLIQVKVKRVDLDNHIKNICPKTILDCPFKDQGCSIQVERQHVDKHVQDNMAAHMMLLAKQCSSLTIQNSSLTEQNTTLTENCSALAEGFSALEEECSELNRRCLRLVEKNRQFQEELMSQVKENCSYFWTIYEFPSLSWKHGNGSAFTSPIFWLHGHRLCFLVYPNGLNKEAEGWLSLYLNLSEEYPKSRYFITKTPCNINNAATVKCRLSVKSVNAGTDDVSAEATHVFKEPGNCGWSKFMKTTDALSTVYCNSTNSLTIQCTIIPDEVWSSLATEWEWEWDSENEWETESESESESKAVQKQK